MNTSPAKWPSRTLWRWFQLPFAVRVFALYFVFVGMSGYFMLNLVVEEVKPGVRQSTEEVLFDTAQVLADLVAPAFAKETPEPLSAELQQLLASYGQHQTEATIWGISKGSTPHRIYLTDRKGIVVYDSTGTAVGKDYSRWNDVYLTLRGQYGARSSKANPEDENSSVMHVAAAIRQQNEIIGVLTIAKPNQMMQPFIDRTQAYLTIRGLALMALGLAIGALLAWRLQRGLNRLELYAEQLSSGERVDAPKFRVFFEFGKLAAALDRMRHTLAGRAYAEQYVQTLTHELKSPLTAIQAAAELLQQQLPDADRQRFAGNILQQSSRLHQIIERLLRLSALEQQQHLRAPSQVSLPQICQQALNARAGRIDQQQWQLQFDAQPLSIEGDAILLEQALGHMLDNALDFAPKAAIVALKVHKVSNSIVISLCNQGPQIPDYALPRLTERFYSLARPGKSGKSTGLGLNFVDEVMKLHHGKLSIENTKLSGEPAVLVSLELPIR
jgi:two-component system sensor histidine kinase CreC